MSHINTLMDTMWEYRADLRTDETRANMVTVGAQWLEGQGFAPDKARHLSTECVEGTRKIALAERVYTGVLPAIKKGVFSELEINAMVAESQDFEERIQSQIWVLVKANAVKAMKEGKPKAEIWAMLKGIVELGYPDAEIQVKNIIETLKNTPHGKES